MAVLGGAGGLVEGLGCYTRASPRVVSWLNHGFILCSIYLTSFETLVFDRAGDHGFFWSTFPFKKPATLIPTHSLLQSQHKSAINARKLILRCFPLSWGLSIR